MKTTDVILEVISCYFCETVATQYAYFEPFIIPDIRTGDVRHVHLCPDCIGEIDATNKACERALACTV